MQSFFDRKMKLLTNFGVGLSLLVIAISLNLTPDSAISKSAFVRDCPAKDAGEWNWGEAPSGCDASRYGDTSRIKFLYQDFVFDRTLTDEVQSDEARKDYVTAIHALLRDLATEHIKSKKSDVRFDEIEAFVRAIESVAHQETYWSHYRIGKDGRFKLMTGDKNISHGMMQINQKYHASKGRDNSFDLVGNISFGIEHFYVNWETATRARCVYRAKNQSREQTLLNISRAAYSAYNGGADAICRWTNPKHPWAKNDKNYFQKLKQKAWSTWVRSDDHKLELDLACVRWGDDYCAVAKERNSEDLAGRPLLLEDGATCIVGDENQLECARDLRVFTCLAANATELKSRAPLKISLEALSREFGPRNLRRRDHEDRMGLCQTADKGLALIGDVVTAKRDMPVRAEIGGPVVGYAKKGSGFQVLDLEVDSGSSYRRHYRIRLNSKLEGWIDGGTSDGNSNLADTTLKIESKMFGKVGKSVTPWLPMRGSEIEIVKAGGTKLLVSPEVGSPRTEVKSHVGAGTILQVEDVKVLGAANELWLRVNTGEDSGYIYAGRTFPTLTVEDWIRLK